MANNLKWVRRDLFVSPYCIALCTSEADFHAGLKRLKLPPHHWPPFLTSDTANATTHWFTAPAGHKPCCIVCLPICKKRAIEQVYGLLVHEAVHVWQRIVEHIGEHKPSDEFMAYGIQAIAQELMFAYKEAKK